MKFRSMTAAFILLSACSYDVVKSQAPGTGGPRAAGSVGFDQVLKTSLATNCTSCHADLASYDRVFALRATITQYVTSGYMPKGKAMPDDQRKLLLDWLAAGAPRDPSGTSPTPAPTPASTPCTDDDIRAAFRHGDDHKEDHCGQHEIEFSVEEDK